MRNFIQDLRYAVRASFGLTRFIENMLSGVTPTDPLTFTAIVLLLGSVAPARLLDPRTASDVR